MEYISKKVAAYGQFVLVFYLNGVPFTQSGPNCLTWHLGKELTFNSKEKSIKRENDKLFRVYKFVFFLTKYIFFNFT